MSIDYVRRDDHVVTITINRPEARNSMDMEHFYRLRLAWERFAAEDDAYVAIVTGVGQDFCVGADLKVYIPQLTALQRKMQEQEEVAAEIDGYRLDDGIKAVLRGIELYKPVIAAVNGNCVAGGMEMLGGCDLRVASDVARFGVMEPKRGLFAGGGTTVRLPRQVPFPAAMELLLCADRVSAGRAYEMGLLNEVCRPADLMERALDYAHRITANGPLAVRKTKESVLRGLATDMDSAYAIESALSDQVFSSEDAKEGPLAFAEKRTPNWQNR
jgi:enoyl-CoA hydratase